MQPSGDSAILTIRISPASYTTVPDVPYSATRVTTGVQIRPDGDRIDEKHAVLFYRDSAGRSRAEQPVSIPGSPVEIMIMDPTLGCAYILDPGNKIAHKLIGIQVRSVPAVPGGMDALRRTFASWYAEAAATTPDRSAKTRTESLVPQTIQGFEVHGSRTTTTWPVGTLNNNEREVVTIEESWWAPALGGETISSKISRPDLTEDSSLSDIKLGDPDASLFIPPPNYRVVEESNDFQIRIPQPLTPAAMQQFSHDPAPAAIPGAPFSGVKTKTITHALPDGTREKQPERTLFLTWRDSQGRVRTEWPGEGRLIEAVEIQDPIAGFVWSFDYAAKVARRSAFAASPGQNDPAPANSQSLGTRIISGVPANGVKTTAVRARGTASAPDKPLTAVTETWTAGKEGITLLEKTSTSGGDEALAEFKYFTTMEPDPGLFRIPATYRVIDGTGSQISDATAHAPPAPANGTPRSTVPAAHPKPEESVFTFISAPGMNTPAITRAPYLVKTISATFRLLPEGTRSTQSAETTMANYGDSMGRSRVDGEQGGLWTFAPNTAAVQQQRVILPDIKDPVAGYRYILDPVHQTAHRLVITTRRVNPAQPAPTSVLRTPPPQKLANGTTNTFENLGLQTINGLLTQGLRTTTITPARSPQDHPTTTVGEMWSSVQYPAVLRSTSTGPNFETTTTAKEVSQSEPDPALFQVPRDYKIVDEEGTFSITFQLPTQ